ncbi:ATP-dependent endonuclease, partial [Paraburkholderia sp. JPY454]|nr:ATP-dependent endonuclease [Paraburkholderia youngii]
TTVVVGRNNSGKTSLSEVIRRLIADGSAQFQLEDFSSACYEDVQTQCVAERQQHGSSGRIRRRSFAAVSHPISDSSIPTEPLRRPRTSAAGT